jgi:hypothetical protein
MTAQDDTHGLLAERVRGWFIGRLPGEWFEGPPEVIVDREEITVIGRLGLPGSAGEPVTADEQEAETADQQGETAGQAEGAQGGAAPVSQAFAIGRARRFRAQTREARIEIALEAERTFGRKVSWGVVCGDQKVMFTTFSVPVMTRLRQPERRVLDTLVDAGVARSRSEALAWCVRLVGQHEDSWLADLRAALSRVEMVRQQGPSA